MFTYILYFVGVLVLDVICLWLISVTGIEPIFSLTISLLGWDKKSPMEQSDEESFVGFLVTLIAPILLVVALGIALFRLIQFPILEFLSKK